MSQTKQRDVYMVIGGNGFLGRHIVQQLLERGDIVSAFDIVERYNDVQFYSGDISDQDSVASALRKVRFFFFFDGILFYACPNALFRVERRVLSTRHLLILN